MITRKEFDRLLEDHTDAVMSAVLRKDRNRPKPEYDEACLRAVRTAEALWIAFSRTTAFDDDPTPHCSYGHKTKAQCDCGEIAKND